MNLISTLNAGVAAAANGWAEVYIRGTSTRATVYYDFEASTSDSSGDNIDLDAYGAVEVYVNQLVDVVAKSPDGTIIRSWTDGYSSPNVEVISPAFTGADYVSGTIAVNEPTTLQAVLNLWETNAGAPDWKVNIGGTATTLETAFGNLAGLVFNVKNPIYGAVGDGVTNDQAAIQAALAAAVAAGGGTVFFPKGTYLISTAIEWSHLVGMLGIGGGLSVITTNSAVNARMITLTSGTGGSQPTTISGMTFAATVANSGEQLYTSGSTVVNLLVTNCWFGSTSTCIGRKTWINAAGSRVVFQDCRWSVNDASLYPVTTGSDVYASYYRCFFITTGTTAPSDLLRVQGTCDVVHGCVFDNTSVSSAGTYAGIQQANTGGLYVAGCTFRSNAQVFDSCIDLTGGHVTCHGNNFGGQAASTWYDLGTNLSAGSCLQGSMSTSTNTTTPSIPLGAVHHQHTSNTTVPTFTMPIGPYIGAPLVLVLTNNSGAGWVSVVFSGASVQRVTTLPATDVPNAATVACTFYWTGTFWLLCHRD